MKIAVDARELAGRPTGVGRYLASLLEEWAHDPEARRHEWQLFTHEAPGTVTGFPGAVRVLPGGGGTRWEQWTLARALAREKPDVLFAPAYTAPLTAPCPVALTVHDVSFAAHPEWFAPREGLRRRVLTAWSIRRARVVLTDTEFSRREILAFAGVAPGRVRVVPLGMRRAASTPAEARSREPLVLYVGSLFRRRHVDRLIEAFVTHVAPRVAGSQLAIVGENRLYPPGNPAEQLQGVSRDIARRVSLHAYVDEARLLELYRRASVFAFLSEYEGFGLTPLEALAAGVPPVVLDTPVAREVYGPAACYVPSTSASVVGDALCRLLGDEAARRDVLQHADRVLAQYRWSNAAAATRRAIEEAAGV